MPFVLEKELAAPVSRWLCAQGLVVKHEFKTQWGICDVVACELDPEKVSIRIRQRQSKPLGTASRVFVHQRLPDADVSRRGISVDRLQRVLNFSEPEKLKSELEKLVATGHAKRTAGGCFLKVNGWAPLHKRLLAVELKLTRISEAIAQAKANRNFAPQSYVAMPLAVAERALSGRTRDAIIAAGVGMIGVGEDDCTLLMQAAKSSALSPIFEMHAVEQFWKVSGLGN